MRNLLYFNYPKLSFYSIVNRQIWHDLFCGINHKNKIEQKGY